VEVRAMKSIIVAIAMFLSLVAGPARATNFNIFFFEGFAPGGLQIGSGTYSVADGKLTAFHALITGCINDVVVCNFNGTSGADPFDGIPSETFFFSDFPPINGQTESFLDLLESSAPFAAHTFTTHTPGAFDPDGVYTVAATPEPSALWLILAGVALLVVRRLQQISKLVGGYMKTIIIAAILLLATAAHATPTVLVLFDEGEPLNANTASTPWPGHYLWTGSVDFSAPNPAFTFLALIGKCQNPTNCIYNDLLEGIGGFTANTTIGFEIIGNAGEIHGIADGYRYWQTNNGLDSQELRFGRYCVVGTDAGCIQAVPEPSTLWLFLAGSLSLLWMKPKR
jgi:PEP-CTERM motif